MSLNIMQVVLNMDTVNFLGISIVGHSHNAGDGGIFVANIMQGGAVALDGRIAVGDMILQVNDVPFEALSNDEAVRVLRDAVQKPGPIVLTVAKNLNTPAWGGGGGGGQPGHGQQPGYFTIPQQNEPVRPIDPGAWVRHTNACRALPSILEGSEGALTPVPGQFRPPSTGTAVSSQSGPDSGQQLLHGHGPTNDYLRGDEQVGIVLLSILSSLL